MRYYDALAEHLADIARSAPRISHWPVGRHIEHCAIVASEVVSGLKRSPPGAQREPFGIVKHLVMALELIPRGIAKAPAAMEPVLPLQAEAIRRKYEEVRAMLQDLSGIPAQAWWQHPKFGIVHTRNALRLLEVHSKHHLKIIREICR